MTGFKGFNSDWTCHKHQFEVGKTFTFDGEISLCNQGFHFCENPMDLFAYYPPTGKFAAIEADGVDATTGNDSKRVCRSITIKSEVFISEIVQAGVKFVFDHADWSGKKSAATGERGAASATGYRGAASATGYMGAASATGYSGAASAEGKESVAIATGRYSKASGALGCWIVLTERDSDWHIIEVKAFKVDGDKIKPNVFYELCSGKAVQQ